jgi:MFS family permease
MNAVRRLGFVLIGAAIAALLAYGTIGIIGRWYELHFAKNDHDLSIAYIAYLLALLVCTVFGGWLGDRLHKRSQT